MQEIFLGVGLFTSIVLMLALLILLARFGLVPRGNVTINVNDERDLSVPVGGRLLGALHTTGVVHANRSEFPGENIA